ncbi:Gfo/Idh/MocA family protein [Streptomyces nogalater]
MWLCRGLLRPHIAQLSGNQPHRRLRPQGDRAKTFVAEYGGRLFGSMDEVLADPEVEIVVNLTPTAQHYAVNKAALSAGKHVYCEKPMTTNMAEARNSSRSPRSAGFRCAAPRPRCSAGRRRPSSVPSTTGWWAHRGSPTPRSTWDRSRSWPTATGAASAESPGPTARRWPTAAYWSTPVTCSPG